jgi:hypothetical protein
VAQHSEVEVRGPESPEIRPSRRSQSPERQVACTPSFR